jgi:predicted ATPase/class 3 adenylate cyclase
LAVSAPSGTVTFLFTDIEGSTRLWEAVPEAMRAAQELHDDVVRSAIDVHAGYVFSTAGDGLGAAFARVGDALGAAVAAQAALSAADWPDGASLRVRMGLHTGEAHERGGDYFGSVVNRAARLMAIGHGGQVLCSALTAGLVGDEATLLDLGEHRLRDLSAPQRVFQVGQERFPPLRSPDLVPTNLPVMVTGIVGRDEEVREVTKLLAGHRLVTLTGPGGVGKTRLALEVAATAAATFPDGAWLVELSPLGRGGDVARAVAAAVGSAAADRDALVAYLADRSQLLLLDNCEYVVDATAELVTAVMAAAREVRVLATSQEPLGVPGELVYRVGALELPEETADPGLLVRSAAVRLFIERAHAANPQFALYADNADAIGAICRDLDGVPLALELAAARARAMPVGEIAERLGERFRLLASAPRAAEERHRTLSAAVAWSHELLRPDESVVFRRLSVFPASFDLKAAEEIAGAGDGIDVLECVVRLVDRSLVNYDTTEGRYRLGQTLRQYAADRLDETGETEVLREAHARYFTGLAARLSAPGGGEEGTARQRIAAELDNLRSAADWFSAGERWRELLRLSRDLFAFFAFHDTADGFRWYQRALEGWPGLVGQARVDALGECSQLGGQVEFTASQASGELSISLADEGGLLHSPWAWVALAISKLYGADPNGAVEAATRAVSVGRQRGDELSLSIARGLSAVVLAAAGEFDRSEAAVREVLEEARHAGDPVVRWNAVVCAAGSYLDRAPPRFAEALAVLEANPLEPGEPLYVLALEQWRGVVLLGRARPGEAAARLARSIRAGDRMGAITLLEQSAAALALACADLGQPALAANIAGYAGARFGAQRSRAPMRAWLDERLDTALASLDPTERAQATERGSRLDRRGFMELVSQTEDLVTLEPY